MGFIETAFDEAPELETPSAGEKNLTIVSVERGRKSKSGGQQIGCAIRVEDEPDTELIYHYLTFPTQQDWEDRPEAAKTMTRMNKRFLAVFGVDYGPKGFDDEELDGATGRCTVVHEMYEGEPRARLRLPKVKE